MKTLDRQATERRRLARVVAGKLRSVACSRTCRAALGLDTPEVPITTGKSAVAGGLSKRAVLVNRQRSASVLLCLGIHSRQSSSVTSLKYHYITLMLQLQSHQRLVPPPPSMYNTPLAHLRFSIIGPPILAIQIQINYYQD